VASAADRPKAPILTYPDAFSALAFLAAQPGIDTGRIGVLGFSWGGVMSLEASELLYAGMFGGGRQFKAHVAHYPVCYAANKQFPGLPPPAQFGSQYLNPTGARVLIQLGSLDDYDNGAGPCKALAQSVNSGNSRLMEVVEYPNALHAFDRLMIPIVVNDPFGNEGSIFQTGHAPPVRIGPNVPQAYAARERAVRFFARHL
jgi:dienelactone hydrolase